MNINEVFKLLDNNEIDLRRLDVPVPESVFNFINILFRGGVDKTSAQKATHEDILRLINATEFRSYLEANFEPIFLSTASLIPVNYWSSIFITLNISSDLVNSMLAFYRKVYSRNGQGDLYRFLLNQWRNHRNTVFQLSALVVIHLLGIKSIKESLC